MKQIAPLAPRRSRSAFTLVEILVVLGILVLLSALLFPVFSRVRESGRRTSCMNNMKQLGLAFSQYLQDHSGRYPYAGNYQGWEKGKASWVAGPPMPNGNGGLANDMPTPPGSDEFTLTGRVADVEGGAIYNYVKNTSTYICPSSETGPDKKLSYSMNCALAGARQFRIKTPNEIVLLVDEGNSLNDGYFWSSNSTTPLATDTLTQIHNGGGNILYADGSVEFVNFTDKPIDSSTQGLANKVDATRGQKPRFRDASLGAGNMANSGRPQLQNMSNPHDPVSNPVIFGRGEPGCY